MKNTYELLTSACSEFGSKKAIQFISDIHNFTKNDHVTYEDLFKNINKTIRVLQDYGIKLNDTVSWILPNCLEAYYCFWAAEAIGVNNPINPEHPIEYISDITKEVDSKLLILPDPNLFPPSNSIKERVSVENPTCKIILLSELMAQIKEQGNDSQIECVKTENDRCVIFSTSGTTAKPKLMAFTNQNRLAMIEMQNQRFSFSEKDAILLGLPLFHVGGATLYNANAFTVGATVVVMGPRGWLEEDLPTFFWKIVAEYGGTHTAALPFTFIQLLKTTIDADISSLKSFLSGMPMEESLFIEFMNKLENKVTPINIYGSTESGCIITTNTDQDITRYRSLGTPLNGQKVKICIFNNGDYMRDAGPNELGTICIQGANIGEYINVPNTFFENTDGKWFKTNDMGFHDDQDRYWFRCRAQDLLYRDNQPISCFDIDLILSKHPNITNVGVIPADTDEGQVPVAFVSLKTSDNIDSSSIEKWFLEQPHATKAMLPAEFYFEEKLPVNGLGKVIKPRLKELLSERERTALTLT